LTVREWEARWWAARVVEKTTRAANRNRLDRHVLPAWGDVELTEIRPLQVQQWVKTLEQSLAPATVASCHQLLSGMLAAAVREGLLTSNPCQHTRLPKAPRGREVYLTREQVDRLADAAPSPRDRLLILLLAYTGLRWGEASGLRISELDLLRRRLTVMRVETRYGPKEYPKSDAGRRLVPLPQFLVDEIAAYLSLADPGGVEPPRSGTTRKAPSLVSGQEAHPAGRSADRSALLFTTRDGMRLRDSPWRERNFYVARSKAGLESTGVRPHDLRHTYCSWLVQAGISLEEVRLLAGHESLKTTLRYSHFKPDHGMGAVAVLERGASGAAQVSSSVLRRPEPT
jgi:integrase